MPSVLRGPELNITLATGNCTLVWSDDYKNKYVVCTTPSVSYVKVCRGFRGHWGVLQTCPGQQSACGCGVAVFQSPPTQARNPSSLQTPTKFVFKHFKASSFSVGSCVFKKELSKGSEKVLYR